MGRANARKQLVCERQVGDALDLVNENRDALVHVLQDDFRIKLDKALPVAEYGLVLPPALQVYPNTQLSQEPVGDAVIPASGIRSRIAHADLFQIEYGNFEPIVLQPGRGCSDQARFAATMRRNDVGIAVRDDGLVKHLVCCALDISCTHCMQRRADAEKLACRVQPAPFGARRLFVRIARH